VSPDEPKYQQKLGNAHNTLGEVFNHTGRASEAEKEYRQAIILAEKAVARSPTNPGRRDILAMFSVNLGDILRKTGQRKQAENPYLRAVGLYDKLVEDFPDTHRYRDNLATYGYSNCSDLYQELGRWEDALDASRKAVALRAKLVNDFPTDPRYLHLLVMAHNKLAFVYRDLGGAKRGSHDWVAAQDYYAKYLKLAEQVAEVEPIPDGKANLAWAYRDLGDLYVEWEKPAVAREHYLKMLEVAKALVEANPKNAQAQKLGQMLVGRAHGYLGHISLELGDPAAQEYFRKIGDNCNLAWSLATCPDLKGRDAGQAVELAKKVSELAPKDGNAWKVLGAAQYRAGDWKAAIEALQKANQLKDGGDGYEWFYLAMAHWKLGDKAQARKWYDQAIQWIEKENPRPGFVFGGKGGEQLRRLRIEAAALLGVKDQPTPPGAKDPPKT
jgi:tetratricopeptide (TPR) repeat protein